MSVSDADIAFAMDLFKPLGPVTSRKMFGGLGLYLDGAIFGVVSSDGAIFLKALGPVAETLEAEGSTQFHNMPYWSVPDACLDSPEDSCALARQTNASL